MVEDNINTNTVKEGVPSTMSVTIQQILQDAKKLSNKLKEDDTAADVILSQTQTVYKKLDAMKQYKEEVSKLNEAGHQRPHAQLIAGIQQENRYLREFQLENKELRAALKEYQNALELIMTKYRQQMTHFINLSKFDFRSLQNEHYVQVIEMQADKIAEMAAVMQMAAKIDEDNSIKDDASLVQRLAEENARLRELLQISIQNGSTKQSLADQDTAVCSDKTKQDIDKTQDIENKHILVKEEKKHILVKEEFRDPYEVSEQSEEAW